MANGSGGLILIGVQTGDHDEPREWPTVSEGQIRLQAIESQARTFVEPYVPVEVAIATSPDGRGEVIVVRVPEGASKPIFVSDRGILIREGEASVPASVAAIRGWLLHEETALSPAIVDFAHDITSNIQADPPVLNIAAYPARAWYASRWDDGTDDAITVIVDHEFPELPLRTISDDLLDFRRVDDVDSVTDWLWFKPSGSMLCRRMLNLTPGRRVPIVEVANALGRTWTAAQIAVPAVMPGYIGPVRLGLAVGSVTDGFSSQDLGDDLLDAAYHRPRDHRSSWARWSEFDLSDSHERVVSSMLAALLRGFGYSGTGRVVDRVNAARPWRSTSRLRE